MGSSSGYGSQNTVKVDDINQQIQKQKQNRIANVDAQKQQSTINQTTHQHPTDGKKLYSFNGYLNEKSFLPLRKPVEIKI